MISSELTRLRALGHAIEVDDTTGEFLICEGYQGSLQETDYKAR